MVTTEARDTEHTSEADGDELPKQHNHPETLSALGDPIVLRLPPQWRLTDDALHDFWELNEPFTFERTAEGDLVIVPPPSGPSPVLGAEISYQLMSWCKSGGGGQVRDASGGFKVGETPPPELEEKQASRIPDVSWLPQEIVDNLDEETYESGELILCPPFIVEIVSAKQTLLPQQRKMQEWLDHGVKLGWLIDRRRDRAWIYRALRAEPEELVRPATLSGEDVLSGFELDCEHIWR